jgi:hypothetical protein
MYGISGRSKQITRDTQQRQLNAVIPNKERILRRSHPGEINSDGRLVLITGPLVKHIRSGMRTAFCSAALLLVLLSSIQAAELKVAEIAPAPSESPVPEQPGQLPHSQVTTGSRDIAQTWLAGPTDRYPHGVLGDRLEASILVVETRAGQRLQVELPRTHVFEDLQARIVDLDGDGRDEILVVESDAARGAALAVYAVRNRRLSRIAATPFIGQPNRWLNPLGAGDFNGDGRLDIAVVATPHIGGILRLYSFTPPELELFAQYQGVSTHAIGSTELGLGQVVKARPRDWLLVPDQAQQVLLLLEWSEDGWRTISRVDLPDRMASSLTPSEDSRWQLRLANGRHIEIELQR